MIKENSSISTWVLGGALQKTNTKKQKGIARKIYVKEHILL
jgi:hypothetical protein